MKIKETFRKGKKDDSSCEDRICITPNFVAVIDGSTSKALRPVRKDISNGQLAAQIIANVIEKIPIDISLQEFCDNITSAISDEYKRNDISRERLIEHPEERLTASLAIYSRAQKAIWMIGDCQCLVDNVFYDNPKPHEAKAAQKRAQIITSLLREGYSVEQLMRDDIARQAIIPMIIESTFFQNKTFSVADGFPIKIDKVRVVPTQNASEIVLASDGYPFLRNTLAESERILADLLARDPLCYQTFKATKGLKEGNQSFDDRSYVRFEG